LFGLFHIILIISVLLINICFFEMWYILYGNRAYIRPAWRWPKDFRRLKLLASQAPSTEVRNKCHLILIGFKISGGLLLIGILIQYIF
jgi:hypothetical protein